MAKARVDDYVPNLSDDMSRQSYQPEGYKDEIGSIDNIERSSQTATGLRSLDCQATKQR